MSQVQILFQEAIDLNNTKDMKVIVNNIKDVYLVDLLNYCKVRNKLDKLV